MEIRHAFWMCAALAALACTDDGKSAGPTTALSATDFTYTLSQSTAALPLWTTPCAHKLRENERPPAETRSGLAMSAARNEYEPVQLVVGPSGGSVTVSIDAFPELGAGQEISVAVAGYEAGYAEHLSPVAPGGTVSLSGSAGVPIWITVHVPADAPKGIHATTVHLSSGGTAVDVPLALTVFDFALSDEIHFASQLNLSIADLVPEGGSQEDAKDMLFAHRLTPASVPWPSGYNWQITWENAASTDPCGILWDEPTEPTEYSIGYLGPRYILGEGWNGVGFKDSMLFQFVDNGTPRPDEFCGIARGADHYGTDAYNAEWSEFLGALDDYLGAAGMSEKTYYYVQNEPQDSDDEALAAYLCDLVRTAAPGLRIAVSEEPKPEIAEDPSHPCGYDIWIAHVRAYQREYAWARQRDFGEAVWLYSLDQDPDPYFNPTRVDVDGMHQRIIPWVSWTLRATGWAYYDAGRFFDGPNPTARAEMLREGFEDYEYLYLANDRAGGGAYPVPFETGPADATAASAASSLTSFTRNADALMALRHELGRYIEGSRDDLPVLEVEGSGRPRGAYYVNFQDPAGEPTAEPLIVDGKTYLKIGWGPYDTDALYGWYGEFVTDPSIALYGYDAADGYSEVQRSYVYDDYGRDNLFEFALENGTYEVTVGAGRPGAAYPNDPHHVTIEGVAVIDDEPTSDEARTFTRTATVEITDGSLSVETGGLSETTGAWSYTFLEYLDIVPVE